MAGEDPPGSSSRIGQACRRSLALRLGLAHRWRLRGAFTRFPIAAILPSRIPRSPEYQGDPVPSMMWALVSTRSKDWAKTVAEKHDVKSRHARMTETIVFMQFPLSLRSLNAMRQMILPASTGTHLTESKPRARATREN